jgi:rubrerythrin
MRSLELKNQNKKYYCSKCGKEITGASTSGMCISCFNKNRDISPDVE